MFADFSAVAWIIGWMAGDPLSDYGQGAAGDLCFVNDMEAFIHREPGGRDWYMDQVRSQRKDGV